ncbi:MAG: hypothetical protein AAGC54_14755 [Cyanobacteria bacterium P01_F01_bin.4]
MNRISRRIEEELGDINLAIRRALQAWEKFEQSDDELYVDSVALNIQGAYTGLERLFEQIAKDVDDSRPHDINWHQQLLEQMAVEISGVRPAVISLSSRNFLDEYRRFSHVVRHTYATKLEADQVSELIESVSQVFAQISTELLAFAKFLEQQG